MLRIVRRRATDGVRFCDGCAEASTPDQRAQRRYKRGHAAIQAWHLPR